MNFDMIWQKAPRTAPSVRKQHDVASSTVPYHAKFTFLISLGKRSMSAIILNLISKHLCKTTVSALLHTVLRIVKAVKGHV